MTTIESKEEISDTDSGIVLHSGKNVSAEWSSDFKICTNECSIADDTRLNNLWSYQDLLHQILKVYPENIKEKEQWSAPL